MYIHAPRPDALSLSVVELVHGHMLLAAPPAEFREQNRAVTALVTPRKLVRRLLLRQLLTNDRSTPRELLLVQMAVVVRVHLFKPLPATTNSPLKLIKASQCVYSETRTQREREERAERTRGC